MRRRSRTPTAAKASWSRPRRDRRVPRRARGDPDRRSQPDQGRAGRCDVAAELGEGVARPRALKRHDARPRSWPSGRPPRGAGVGARRGAAAEPPRATTCAPASARARGRTSSPGSRGRTEARSTARRSARWRRPRTGQGRGRAGSRELRFRPGGRSRDRRGAELDARAETSRRSAASAGTGRLTSDDYPDGARAPLGRAHRAPRRRRPRLARRGLGVRGLGRGTSRSRGSSHGSLLAADSLGPLLFVGLEPGHKRPRASSGAICDVAELVHPGLRARASRSGHVTPPSVAAAA